MPNITAATITLRSTKGSPLTNTEVDNNFNNLNTAIATGLTAASYTAADVLAKLITVDGSGSGLDADLLDGLNSASTNTASTIVARDASGNFSAGTITANLTGTASIAASLNYTVTVGGGGTGSTTAAGARTNLGLVIGTDVQAYDAELAALASTTSAANALPYFTGAGTATTTTLSAYGRSLIDDADAATARTTLGVTIGSDVQGYNANLAAISGVTLTGMYARTGAGTAAVRTITAGNSGITVSNGDGVAGNPTISAAVTSVQGNTGAVIVSVPVTSVQGNTGAVIVTNIAGSSASTSNAHAAHTSQFSHHAQYTPWSQVQGRPHHLSQFANDLGNYGGWVPHNTKVANPDITPSILGRQQGNVGGNCGNIAINCYSRLHLDSNHHFDPHYHHRNCTNCNCNC
jgi:hypothetical protein